MIPYGRQTIEEDDIQAVCEALRSDWLTQGPLVERFETMLATYCGARYAIAFANGTAALQAAYAAAGLGPQDEFITSPLTFAATANAGIWLGARPVFADIDPSTGNIDPAETERKLTPKTKAIVPVDYAGNPADYDRLRELAQKRGLPLIADACHSLGASYHDAKVGSLADMTIFSFHPVKSITTGEGGAVLTSDASLHQAMRAFRHHGIVKPDSCAAMPAWYYEVSHLGINGRLTDIQSALGISQLRKLDSFIARRARIASNYAELLGNTPGLILPTLTQGASSSWHLYPVRVENRDSVYKRLRERGIGTQVHYIPVYRHPYYQASGYPEGLCPKAEKYFNSELSLPIFPGLNDTDQAQVCSELARALAESA